MRIGTIEAAHGQKAFGYFKTGETHGRFDVHIPLHVVRGAQPGPTLVVQAGLSGLEIEPALVLPQVIKALDPAQMRGTLVMVPLLNTSGFEFEQEVSAWDGKHPNAVGAGRADGTITEQMMHRYYQEVVLPADALLDIRTGSQWSYHCYAGVYDVGAVAASQGLAAALGVPQVVLGQPLDASLALAAAQAGKPVALACIGGGPRLRDYRHEDLQRLERAVINALKHLGILEGKPEVESRTVSVIRPHSVLYLTGERGFALMDFSKRGQVVQAGEELGVVRHPFTGAVVERITAPRAGVVVNAGLAWPVPLEGLVAAMIGDVVDEIVLNA